MTNGTEQDGVDRVELFKVPVGQNLTGAQVPRSAQVHRDVFEVEPEPAGRRIEDLLRLGDDLGAGPVSAHHCELHSAAAAATFLATCAAAARLSAAMNALADPSTTSVETPVPL